jgi:hypothetical protein
MVPSFVFFTQVLLIIENGIHQDSLLNPGVFHLLFNFLELLFDTMNLFVPADVILEFIVLVLRLL